MENQDDEIPYYGGYWHVTAFDYGREFNFLFKAIPGTQAYDDLLGQIQRACRDEGLDIEGDHHIEFNRISNIEIKAIWSE